MCRYVRARLASARRSGASFCTGVHERESAGVARYPGAEHRSVAEWYLYGARESARAQARSRPGRCGSARAGRGGELLTSSDIGGRARAVAALFDGGSERVGRRSSLRRLTRTLILARTPG
jgi:hypothetical protein